MQTPRARLVINGQRFVVSPGFADRKSAERRASDIEHDIRAGIHGWKSTIPSFAEWWAIYRKTYTPLKSARNRDAQISSRPCSASGDSRYGISASWRVPNDRRL